MRVQLCPVKIQVVQAGLEQQNASFNAIAKKLVELAEDGVEVGFVDALEQEANLLRHDVRELQHGRSADREPPRVSRREIWGRDDGGGGGGQGRRSR